MVSSDVGSKISAPHWQSPSYMVPWGAMQAAAAVAANGQQSLLLGSLQICLGDMG